MKKILLLTASMFYIIISAQSRQYLNDELQPTSEQDAKFYAIATPENGKYRNQFHYLSGQLYFENVSDKPHYYEPYSDGKYTVYHENGNLKSVFEYANGEPVGPYKIFLENGLIATDLFFEQGKETGTYYEYKSTINPHSNRNVNKQTHYENGIPIKEVVYEDDSQKIRIERTLRRDGYPDEEHFYDKNGQLIGTAKHGAVYGKINGTEVTYYYDPMRVHAIRKYDKDNNDVNQPDEETYYYQNGQVRTKSIATQDQKTTVSYDKSGKEIARMNFKRTDDYFYEPEEGQYIDFNEDSEAIYAIHEFRNFIPMVTTEYYENGHKKTIIEYETFGNFERVTQFDTGGRQTGTLSYQEGMPWNGKFSNLHTEAEYKNGELQSYRGYQPNDGNYELTPQNRTLTRELKRQGNKNLVTIYDLSGMKLISYEKQINERYSFTADIITYENGQEKYRAQVVDGKLISGKFRVLSAYDHQLWSAEKDGTKIQYYSNGKLEREEKIFAKDSYRGEISEGLLNAAGFSLFYDIPTVAMTDVVGF